MVSKGRETRKKVKIKTKPLAAALLVLVLLVGGGVYLIVGDDEQVTEPPEEKEEEKDKETDTDPIDEKDEEDIARCEYCGTDLEEHGEELDRPVALTLGNSGSERPHSGINSACVMYEVPVEGSVTRLQAVYNHDYPERIGPIRSARYYTISLAMEHDAIYAHIQGYQPVMNKIRDLSVPTINEYGDGSAFWRSDERNAPYNTYTTIEDLVEAADNRGYRDKGDRDSFIDYKENYSEQENFISDYDQGEHSETAEEITVDYYGELVEYYYDYEQNDYERHIGGEPHIDDEDEEVVTAQDLIFQFVNSRVIDDQGRRELDMVGEGEGLYLAGGELIPLTWEKDDHDEPTEFFHAETGEPLEIRPGLTWVNVIPNEIRDDVVYQ